MVCFFHSVGCIDVNLLKLTLQVDPNSFSATAQSVQTMIIGRLLAGIGIGISSAIVPLYISEVLFYDFIPYIIVKPFVNITS